MACKLLFFFLIALLFVNNEAAEDRCNQPIDSGPCYAYFPMYAFDTETGKCVEFVYGGCLGNSNRFKTLKKCRDTCEEDCE